MNDWTDAYTTSTLQRGDRNCRRGNAVAVSDHDRRGGTTAHDPDAGPANLDGTGARALGAASGRLLRARLALDEPVHPDARAARHRAVPVRPRRLRPDGRAARRCTTASRPCTSRGYSFAIGHLGHDRHGYLRLGRDRGRRTTDRLGAAEVPADHGGRRSGEGRRRRSTSRSRRSSSTWTAATATSSTSSARPSCTSTPASLLRTSRIRCCRSAAATSAARRSSRRAR